MNFFFGLVLGLVISLMLTCFTSLETFRNTYGGHSSNLSTDTLLSFLGSKSIAQATKRLGDMHDLLDRNVQPMKPVIMVNDSHFHHDNDSVAKDLERRIRVLCWIMTCPPNLNTKAIHIKKTWGKRCNILVFMSSKSNPEFPAVGLDVGEGREHLTAKSMKAFRYVYEHYKDKADWFLKADDDTYVILENLRYFLKDYSPSDPVYFGHHFKTFVKQGYYSGGAGYVLSHEALTRLAKNGTDPKICRQDGGYEDVEIGHCLQNLGVRTANSTDALGRSRFHCFQPETHLFGSYQSWYYQYDANGAKKGTESISDYAISFHYVPPNQLYSLEFYIYHLRPYGIESGRQHL